MTVTIPESHRDLIEGAVVVTLATITPAGRPHSTAIWCSYDGSFVRFITSHGTQKERNLQENPYVSLMALDPQNPYRYLEVRGMIESITPDGALEQLDQLTQLYTSKPAYYGHIVPAEEKGTRVHLLCTIRPTWVVAR